MAEIMKKSMYVLALLLIAAWQATRAQNDLKMTTEANAGGKVLVAFFSHKGENYGVGRIEKGNTHIVAEAIAAETGGALFEIVPQRDYPESYDACTEAAKREQAAQARPALVSDAAVEAYDVIFIGYPNWWGDMPMPVYTFIEKHDWSGKRVIPFCTHEGSGLSGTERRIAELCEGAAVGKGLSLRGATAQNSPDRVRQAVRTWLERLN